MKKIQKIDEYPSAPLNMVPHPDWGVLQALHTELKWFPQNSTIDWIQSHQDDNPNIVLPIPVKLNVLADKLAILRLNNLPSKIHVPFDPSVKIQLNFAGVTVTQIIPSFLQEQLLLPPLHQ